ncbi:general secretion pathway protein GspL [Acinetobacter sp. TGL-Y2]|uniref:type II secretion system protein GspL n=1 Tax=Acinetobacter sp. TGL-Y2 TaxID=1407071 RepID=UPI0007A67BAE|nr:type II secretion system protein GspL [Acinetobacter sp. TGL-Y2]AMW79207.1 general secretion pathway protein GspL [Acinetobacter sp. TGL-Y2]
MLYLWMPEANGVWQWSRGESWIQASTLELLIQDIKPYQGEEATVFFPSRDVQIIQQTLTKAQYKQLGVEGIKYLLEEYVIQPIDQMKVLSHFQAPDQLTILGISHNRVLTMQHALTLIPVKLVALLPDFMVLPTPKSGEMVLANINDNLLARHGALLGASVDDLELYLNVLPKSEQYLYSELTDDQAVTLFQVASVEQRESFHYRFEPLTKAKSHPFNVLPKAKSEDSGISGYWKACAALCVALIMVQLVFDLNRWVKLKKVADETAVVAVDQYKSWFGANSRVTEQNLKSMFESHLRMSQSADTQALQLISRIGPILMQQQIVANRVAYDSNVLNLDLLAQSSEALQSLVTQLNQQGFKAELGNVQTQGSMVLGLVKIQ